MKGAAEWCREDMKGAAEGHVEKVQRGIEEGVEGYRWVHIIMTDGYIGYRGAHTTITDGYRGAMEVFKGAHGGGPERIGQRDAKEHRGVSINK